MTEAVAVGAEPRSMLLAGRPTASGESLAVVFPYDGTEAARVWLADEAMVEQALASAAAAEAEVAALPPYRRAEILMKHGLRLLGNLDETGRSNWMGFRPSMPDSLPVISRGTRWANTYFAYGHGHIGLTLG